MSLSGRFDGGVSKDQLAALQAENARLREACEQLLRHVEQDEATHGRPFAAGNVAREALAEKETL